MLHWARHECKASPTQRTSTQHSSAQPQTENACLTVAQEPAKTSRLALHALNPATLHSKQATAALYCCYTVATQQMYMQAMWPASLCTSPINSSDTPQFVSACHFEAMWRTAPKRHTMLSDMWQHHSRSSSHASNVRSAWLALSCLRASAAASRRSFSFSRLALSM